MNKLEKTLQKSGVKLMTHFVAGFPDVTKSETIARSLAASGADILEMQIAFSDPVADGPTLLAANQIALENGVKVANALGLAKVLSEDLQPPLVLMTYFNIIFHYGIEEFCAAAKEVGISGLIVPDFPLEMEAADHLLAAIKAHDLAWIPVVAPTSTAERIQQLAPHVDSFWYAVSRSGVTGTQSSLGGNLAEQAAKIRSISQQPIAFAFGVKTAEDVNRIAEHGDIAVIGSAIQECFLSSPSLRGGTRRGNLFR